ncbi:hypothetical protein [Actomonas aquatica]|uniref:Chalcone isomerase domain-containing protein n=1 Tax=Actomonas aquatica TaxID=2866162 RepID=A0ABZ1CIC7_9BACT|nr:hypothetical protein [Opitutus sp. WL0086]WRQ90000.1 hypothetical protein K1X11_011330 [Opitutus sp. WL0086]
MKWKRSSQMWGVVLWVLGAAVATTAQGQSRTESFTAGQRVKLSTRVPLGYSFEQETDSQGVTLIEMLNPVWRISLRVYISGEVPAEASKTEWQRNLVVQNSSMFLSQSKEQDYRWQALVPEEGSGVYCVFSDARARKVSELPPDGFMHVVTGVKVIRGAVMYFQIWCNDMTVPEYQEIFDLLLYDFDRG